MIADQLERAGAALVFKLIDDATADRADDLVTRIVGMLTKMCHFPR